MLYVILLVMFVETFQCPPSDYVKCPNAYCIPIRFLCNDRVDCPQGEDERQCGE